MKSYMETVFIPHKSHCKHDSFSHHYYEGNKIFFKTPIKNIKDHEKSTVFLYCQNYIDKNHCSLTNLSCECLSSFEGFDTIPEIRIRKKTLADLLHYSEKTTIFRIPAHCPLAKNQKPHLSFQVKSLILNNKEMLTDSEEGFTKAMMEITGFFNTI